MLRTTTLLLFLYAVPLLAQKGNIRPEPHWKMGDKRKADATVESHLLLGDVPLDLSARSSYFLEVEQVRKDSYVLALWMDPDSDPLSGLDMSMGTLAAAAQDSIARLIQDLTRGIFEPLKSMRLRFSVSLKGDVVKRMDAEADRQRTIDGMREGVVNMVTTLAKRTGQPMPDVPKERIDHLADSMYNAFVRTQENEMGYLLRAYAHDYPPTGSVRMPALIHDVEAPLRPELPEVKAMMELGLDKNAPDELVCRVVTTYDPDALYAAFTAQGGTTIQRKGLSQVEETVDRIDRRSGWLTASSTVMTLKSEGVQARILTNTKLTVVQ